MSKKGLTYAQSGVDIDAGNRMVEMIKPLVKATARKGADAEIGGFGGLFDLKRAGFKDPVLVAANDGVGTKVKIAIESGIDDTVGIDLVAMSVNDLVVQGAEPLFFLDYFATGKLDPKIGAEVVKGIADGCRQAGCALIGGETAEMPGVYHGDDYDLAGFAVGAVERGAILPRDDIAAGDVILGIASSGVHSNGYSLVRKVVAKSKLKWSAPAPFDKKKKLGAAVLTPTRIYVKSCLAAIRETGAVKALAHITGGGFPDNIPRVLPKNLAARIDVARIPMLPVFKWLAKTGGIAEKEMLRTFNCGIGMIAVVEARRADKVAAILAREGESVVRLGELVAATKGKPRVTYTGRLDLGSSMARKRVAVLISGRGSNMVALIEAAKDPAYPAEIAVVVSNDPASEGLKRAAASGIATAVVDHKKFGKDREAFERALQDELQAHNIELVCLAGFMRLLTSWFVRQWEGRLLNIHPALLPAFKGLDTHARALSAGVKEHGATVHFVVPEMDSGPIILQAAVPVMPNDTEATLAARVLAVEHRLYPQALRLVAEGRVQNTRSCRTNCLRLRACVRPGAQPATSWCVIRPQALMHLFISATIDLGFCGNNALTAVKDVSRRHEVRGWNGVSSALRPCTAIRAVRRRRIRRNARRGSNGMRLSLPAAGHHISHHRQHQHRRARPR